MDIAIPVSEQSVPNEQLETDVRVRIGDHLRSANADVVLENQRQGRPEDARVPASPQEVIARRQTLRERVKGLRGKGWRVAGRVVLEIVKEGAFEAVRWFC